MRFYSRRVRERDGRLLVGRVRLSSKRRARLKLSHMLLARDAARSRFSYICDSIETRAYDRDCSRADRAHRDRDRASNQRATKVQVKITHDKNLKLTFTAESEVDIVVLRLLEKKIAREREEFAVMLLNEADVSELYVETTQ